MSARPSPHIPTSQDAIAPLWASLSRIESKLDQLLELMQGRPARFDDDPVEALRIAAVDLGVVVSVDDHVTEYGAARLIGRSASTLRNWRVQSRPIPYRKFGSKIEYRLSDIAAFMQREDDPWT